MVEPTRDAVAAAMERAAHRPSQALLSVMNPFERQTYHDRATLAAEVERLNRDLDHARHALASLPEREELVRLRADLARCERALAAEQCEHDITKTSALMQAHRAFWLNHALTQAGQELPNDLEDALVETFDGCWDDDGNIVKALPAETLWPNGRPVTDTTPADEG